MKAKWTMRYVAAALCLASLAGMVQAQERAAPAPIGERPDAPADAMEGLEGMDELDLLLAADVAPGPGAGAAAMGRGMGPGRGRGMRRGPGGEGAAALREKLNLTEDQKSKLADIRDRRARAAIPIQGDLRIAGLDLRKLMRADKPDQRAIETQIDRISGLRASLQKSRVAGMLEARSVLTPAQQKVMRQHRGNLMGRRMHGGSGMRMRHL